MIIKFVSRFPPPDSHSIYRVRKKNIKIHVPLEVRHHKHTHTIIKNIHHCHKPRKPIKNLTSKDLQHEHVHHHYRDDDNQLITLNENAFMPSSSNKKEHRIIYNDNLVNIENEALESLAVLQSSVSEVRATPAGPLAMASEVVTARVATGGNSRTKLPAVARSRAHANSRRRSPTTTTAAPTIASTTTKTVEEPVETVETVE